MLNWSAEADHAAPDISKNGSNAVNTEPKILKESFEELHRAVKAAILFHPEYPLRPTMLAIKRKFLLRSFPSPSLSASIIAVLDQ